MMKMLTTSAAGVRLAARQTSTILTASSRASRASTIATNTGILVSSRRQYATHHQTQQEKQETSKRRAVTPFNDDGHVPWAQLSAGEKAGRAVQQSFNFGLVILGVVMTVCFTFFLSLHIRFSSPQFSSCSHTLTKNHKNREESPTSSSRTCSPPSPRPPTSTGPSTGSAPTPSSSAFFRRETQRRSLRTARRRTTSGAGRGRLWRRSRRTGRGWSI